MRKIIHIDMDAFYASVEQRDRPQLKGKPVIVVGDPNSRGVVAACSYEAREFGIHSAMASSTAYRLCPNAVFIRPRFDAYRAVSSEIRKFFGVGKVTEEKMVNLRIKTGADLKKFKKEQLIELFGKSGDYFYDIAHGMDERPVEPNRIRKSIGKETTLVEDIDDTDQMLEILEGIAVRILIILRKKSTLFHSPP